MADDLRLSVYQTALQGKLTEQLSSDSSVEKLIERIQRIKNKMILDGKIKKEKKLPPVDDAVLFDIPNNWKWVRMQTFLDVRDGTHDSPKYVPVGVPFVTSKNISKGYLDFSDINYITQIDADKINQRSLVEDNDILLAMIGSIGNPVKVKKDREFAIKNMALIKAVPDSYINMDYVLLLLKYMQIKFKFDSSGGVQNFVSLTYLREFQVPLPPIEEQQRIVDRVDELMEQIDEYAKIEQKLISLKDSFPGDLRSALLQAAMQGKLTKQLDTDSSVDELIVEKTESEPIKKRGKKISKMDIEVFDIPSSWRWTKLSECGTTNIGLTYSPEEVTTAKEGTVVLRSSNIQNGKMDYTDIVKVNMQVPENKKCHIGDILICARNGSKRLVGKTSIIDREGDAFGAFMAIYRSACNPYIYYVLNSPHFRKSVLGGAETTTINQVTQDMVENYMFPLPPIEEQERIVKRLEMLLPMCEEL
ncbi:MAG: restriction endonuclease subunit S [Lachnospiraceae bacterium]|nr:restriction endonuclease subunit S [Lachnospiraceae bacterium]